MILHEPAPHPEQPDGEICECGSGDIESKDHGCDQCEGEGGEVVECEEAGNYAVICKKCNGSGEMWINECYDCGECWECENA